jgi:glutamyl-tRNA reductase
MVVGEGQILGQVRQALRLAQEQDGVGREVNEVVQRALRVGKRAHNETGIDQAGASLVSVGLGIAAEYLGPLSCKRALVVGAGSMSGLAAATLDRVGVAEIVIANRTFSRGSRLAKSLQVPARAIELTDLEDALKEADLVVTCIGAAGLVITAEMLTVRAAPTFLLDLALPHDVDRAVRDLPGVELAGLDDLRTAQQAGQAVGADAVEAVRRIVAEEVAMFLGAARAAAVAPTVVALRSKAADVVEAELARLAGRLPGLGDQKLDDKVRGEIAQTVRRVVDKLLHAPTVRIKELAAAPGGDAYATALRELFDLDPKGPEAVARADIKGTEP